MADRVVHHWRTALPVLGGTLGLVREVVASDAATLSELLSDPAVTPYVSTPPPSVEAFHGFIAWAQRERALGSSVCFGIVPTGLTAAVGIIQIRFLEPGGVVAEWGFAIAAAFWGTGVFDEAARLVVQFAFEHMGIYRLEARAVTINGRGNGILQKLGATPEGVLSRSFLKDGGYREQFLWALLADEWKRHKRASCRFVPSAARARVTRVVERSKQEFLRTRLENGEPDQFHPFFITASDRLCPACKTRIPVGVVRCPECGRAR